MDTKDIQRYIGKSVPALQRLAQEKFNRFIRNRDAGLPCISCNSMNTEHASHYYSAGKYFLLRFNEDNVNLACKKCNYFLSGNLLEYRKGLIKKIGIERVEALDVLAAQSKRTPQKKDKMTLIAIISKYK